MNILPSKPHDEIDEAIDLRCSMRLHARLVGDVLEIHCRSHSKDLGAVVKHRWKIDSATGVAIPLPDAVERERDADECRAA